MADVIRLAGTDFVEQHCHSLTAQQHLEKIIREREQKGKPVHPELREALIEVRQRAELARQRILGRT